MKFVNQSISLSDSQISSLTGDEMVILEHQKGFYYGLNDVGTTIWEKIKESPTTFTDLKAFVLSQYEIDEKTVENDLQNILLKLSNENLIKISE